MTKQEIRKLIATEKKKYGTTELDKLSAALFQLLEEHPLFQKARTVLLYYALPREVNTHAFIEKWYHHKQILLPIVVGDNLELRQYSGPSCMREGAFHIMEPTGDLFNQFESIELSIIPGVAFDAKGHRLGRGKGYYDRLLPKLKSYNIGVCYQFQVIPEVPTDEYDQPMDEVWTEKGKL